jgi:hypothetical protein
MGESGMGEGVGGSEVAGRGRIVFTGYGRGRRY